MTRIEELRSVLDGLDIRHAELIHSRLCYDLMEVNVPALIGSEEVRLYLELSRRLFKEKSYTVLSEMNSELCRLMTRMEEEQQAGVVVRNVVGGTIELIRQMASRPVREFPSTLMEE